MDYFNIGGSMRTECGVVVDIQKNFVILEVTPQDVCASCAAHSACAVLGGGKKQIFVKNSLQAQKGDLVEFGISDRGSLISALIVYGLPIALLLAGMLAGSLIFQGISLSSDGAMAVGGTAGILLSFGLIKLINPIVKRKNLFRPYMLRILKSNNS